jgi:hypothetical protein
MKIWAFYKQTGKTELVDTCTKKDACYLVHEYQLAFGRDCVVWSGLKRDNPVNRRFDETAHYKCER